MEELRPVPPSSLNNHMERKGLNQCWVETAMTLQAEKFQFSS